MGGWHVDAVSSTGSSHFLYGNSLLRALNTKTFFWQPFLALLVKRCS